ncbi:TIGR04282 family arsenosugar biosynthesis glycosyltransferase [Robiginitalea marina]|uniref:DUF2064 domain-containing protein n=1 Tax=Robiginitalea marina TaxID=2954105 RepID=A0ABT1AW14_9FLAO|nr:DUF2064 domain-containing protein [Robiginitalea marina]MCO5724246.1 DUF2064 domain-containing protein [Robiginitalea marina]
MNTSPAAILVFAQSAHLDAAQKGLRGSEALFDQLTRQTLRKARQTGLPCFHVGENEQQGETFALRLYHAMDSVFRQGFDRLVVIGNDSPDLLTETLLQAAAAIGPAKAVLGPSGDGGVYLIGIHRTACSPEVFLQLPWQQEDLFEHMVHWLGEAGNHPPVILAPRMDLDTLSDLRNWVGTSSIPGSLLKQLAKGLSKLIGGIIAPRTPACAPGYALLPCNKGSPVR